jgi:hypothetical protein
MVWLDLIRIARDLTWMLLLVLTNSTPAVSTVLVVAAPWPV